MEWWILEVVRFVVLIGLAVGLQRLIRRSGETYAQEVFRATPRVGEAFLVLADIALYLIFAAYTLFNVHFQAPNLDGRVDAAQAEGVVYSVAGIALIIGILHGINVVVLPLIGSMLAKRSQALPAESMEAPAPAQA